MWLVKDKRTGKWNARWLENGEVRQRATGTRDKGKARQIAHSFLGENSRNTQLSLSELHARRIVYLRIDGTDNTIEREITAYKAFRAFLKVKPTGGTPTLETFDAYKAFRRSNGVSDNTINGDLKHLQAMFNWGSKRGYCESINIPKIRVNESDPVFLEEEEITAFFKAIDEVDPICPKYLARLGNDLWRDYWRMIFEIYFQTGARRDEVADLKWEDIDFTRSEITFKNTKGKKDRTVPVSYDLLNRIKRFRDEGFQSPCIHQGQRNLRIYKRYALAAGIKKKEKLKIHIIRHTVASHMHMRGVPLKTIRDILGHRKIMTTTIYTHASGEHYRKAILNLPWVSEH